MGGAGLEEEGSKEGKGSIAAAHTAARGTVLTHEPHATT